VGVTVLLSVYTKDICHFRFFSVLRESGFCACVFHRSALLFVVKIVKRAFEFGDALGDEVQIAESGVYR
jgi:hypothetical protein